MNKFLIALALAGLAGYLIWLYRYRTSMWPWAGPIRKYLILGETPPSPNPYGAETSVTFLERKYYTSAGQPVGFRRALLKVINTIDRTQTRAMLLRGLELIQLIPHRNFTKSLKRIFLEARKSGDKEVAVAALYAMQGTPFKPKSGEYIAWKNWWLERLDEDDFAVAGFNGIRRIDLSDAFNLFPRLLRRELPGGDNTKEVLLRGLQRDAEESGIEVGRALVGTLSLLRQDERVRYMNLFEKVFGGERMSRIRIALKPL